MENTICHFEIPADDLEQARKFYGALFAWKLEDAPHLGGEYVLLRTSTEPGAVAGGLLRRVDERHGVTLYFAVESIDESARKLVELGGTVVVPKTALPRLGWTIVARDPQGNSLGLFQEDPAAG